MEAMGAVLTFVGMLIAGALFLIFDTLNKIYTTLDRIADTIASRDGNTEDERSE